MSILAGVGRPWVEFNPGNKQHREWYAEFVQTQTWAACPVRFTLRGADANGNVFTIERMMMEFYINAEFGQLPQAQAVLAKRAASRVAQMVDTEVV